ncbi:cellulase family glycosylhydrolase [Massilia sp. TWP1-3-3]|uniref:cellulase family glycosylhydrolase n=1 Tax=Massilia sp. TWP1-3-3 TaxID=2804573 RepID=UPI003CFB7B00
MKTTTTGRRLATLGVVLLAFGASGSGQAHSVSGSKLLDTSGKEVVLRGVNWFGFETYDGAVHGLWARNWRDMLDQIQATGFNALRLPLCPAAFRGDGKPNFDARFNPELVGMNTRQFLDLFLTEVDRRGMYILLDHHRPDCNAISPLWYTSTYSEAQWLTDLEFLARKYAGLKNLIGIDLKNEPYGASWGTGDATRDWNLAAERAAARILAANPNLLVFVEGVAANPVCSANTPVFWGENLEPLKCKALNIARNKLVLSPHVYGPDVYNQSYFGASNFPANMPAIWDQHFGQFAATYPVVLGEFGGKYGHGGNPNDKVWQDALVTYMKQRGMGSSFYWTWNPNSGDTGGILQDDWKTVWPDKVALLKRLWDGAATPPPPPPPPPPPASAVSATLRITSDWAAGYCADVAVKNSGSVPVVWKVLLTVQGRVNNLWNADYTQSGATLAASGKSYNATVQPNGTQSFGFCAVR